MLQKRLSRNEYKRTDLSARSYMRTEGSRSETGIDKIEAHYPQGIHCRLYSLAIEVRERELAR
jgi:hypothetical protein